MAFLFATGSSDWQVKCRRGSGEDPLECTGRTSVGHIRLIQTGRIHHQVPGERMPKHGPLWSLPHPGANWIRQVRSTRRDVFLKRATNLRTPPPHTPSACMQTRSDQLQNGQVAPRNLNPRLSNDFSSLFIFGLCLLSAREYLVP